MLTPLSNAISTYPIHAEFFQKTPLFGSSLRLLYDKEGWKVEQLSIWQRIGYIVTGFFGYSLAEHNRSILEKNIVLIGKGRADPQVERLLGLFGMDVDGKKIAPPQSTFHVRGLQQIKNNCWINSILHVLFKMDLVSSLLEKGLSVPDDGSSDRRVFEALRAVYFHYKDPSISTETLTEDIALLKRALIANNFFEGDENGMRCASEGFFAIMNVLGNCSETLRENFQPLYFGRLQTFEQELSYECTNSNPWVFLAKCLHLIVDPDYTIKLKGESVLINPKTFAVFQEARMGLAPELRRIASSPYPGETELHFKKRQAVVDSFSLFYQQARENKVVVEQDALVSELPMAPSIFKPLIENLDRALKEFNPQITNETRFSTLLGAFIPEETRESLLQKERDIVQSLSPEIEEEDYQCYSFYFNFVDSKHLPKEKPSLFICSREQLKEGTRILQDRTTPEQSLVPTAFNWSDYSTERDARYALVGIILFNGINHYTCVVNDHGKAIAIDGTRISVGEFSWKNGSNSR